MAGFLDHPISDNQLETAAQLDDFANPSLITTYPDELLVEIFDHFLQVAQQGSFGYPSAFSDTHLGGPHLVTASSEPTTKVFESHAEILGPQAVLLSVCRRWTSVARSEPRLWRVLPLFGPAMKIPRFEPGIYPRERSEEWWQFYDIGLYYKFPNQDAEQQAVHWRMFDDRVSLAQTVPLHLHLFLGLEHTGEKASSQFFTRLCRLIPRTSVLVINCRDPISTLYPLWEDLRSSQPSSELLKTIVFSQHFPPEVIQHWLAAIIVKSPEPPSSATHILSHAFVREIGGADVFLMLLSTIEGLISFQTEESIVSYALGSTVKESGVTHRNLQHLCIGGEGWIDLVPYLTLPALVHLDIGEPDCWPSSDDIAFFKRSGCQLKTFIARHADYMNPEFADFLRLVHPSLEHYRFQMMAGWDECPTPNEVLDLLSKCPPPRLLTGDLHVGESDLYRAREALRGVLDNEAYSTRQRDDVLCSWEVHVYTKVAGDGSSHYELDDLQAAFFDCRVELRVESRPCIEMILVG